jgi:uncharacterized protein
MKTILTTTAALVGYLVAVELIIINQPPSTVSAFHHPSSTRPSLKTAGRPAARRETQLLSPLLQMSSSPPPGDITGETTTTGAAAASAAVGNHNSNGPPEIVVVHQPGEDFLAAQGCRRWGTWGCEVSKFPWTYDSNESCYLLKGKVTVTPTDGIRQPVSFGAGDFVTFPAGMSCIWDVSEPVHKHFKFF